MEQVVGFCEISPQNCGIVFEGFYLIKGVRDIVTKEHRVLLFDVPSYMEDYSANPLEQVTYCLKNNIKVLAKIEFGESRSGKHRVTPISNIKFQPIYQLNELTPFKTYNSNIEFTYDLPYGRIKYFATVYEHISEIKWKNVIFKRTLDELVNQEKAEFEENEDLWIYTITSDDIKEKIDGKLDCYYLYDDNDNMIIFKSKHAPRAEYCFKLP